MRAFVIVGQQESFKLAARELLRTQPAITLAIQQLEEAVGLKLFERTTRKVTLTTEGEHFMPVAQRLIRDFDTAISDLNAASDRRSGHVSMAVVPSVATRLLPDVCKQFAARYPGISVHMIDDNSKGIQRRLARNEVDFSIGGYWRKHQDLVYHPMLEDRIEMVCHKDHPLGAETGPIEWGELRDHQYLDSGLHDVLQAQSLITEPKYEFSTTTLLFAMVKANFGITVLPSLAAQNGDPDLVSRPLVDPVETRQIFLMTRKGWSLSPASEAMIETLLEATPGIIKNLGLKYIDLQIDPAGIPR